jgi:lysophospholipase L1-like esterase
VAVSLAAVVGAQGAHAATGRAGPLSVPTEVERVTGYLPASGAGAGHVVLDVAVRYGDLPVRIAHRVDPGEAGYRGRLRIRLPGHTEALAVDSNPLLLSVPGRGFTFVHRVVLPETVAPDARDTVRLDLLARGVLDLNGDDRPEQVSRDAEVHTVDVRRVESLPAEAAPRCAGVSDDVNHDTPEALAVVCMGEDVSVDVASPPAHGTLKVTSTRQGELRAEYQPQHGFVGRDAFTVQARTATPEGPFSAVAAADDRVTARLDVQPYKLRALGDSIASAWGIYGDGKQMSTLNLLDCRPHHAPANNGCSANSANRNHDDKKGTFLPDFGLGNASAWPAQVALRLGLTGPGQFKNQAIAGAQAVDWDTRGAYHHYLTSIVGESPDLVLLSLGANPLLSTVLIGKGATCAFNRTPEFMRCVRRYIDDVHIREHMAHVLEQLVSGAQHATVVLALYHTAVPAISTFRYYESGWILEQVNRELLGAAADARNHVGGAAGQRLKVMQPPRFDVGMPLRNVSGDKIGRGGPFVCGSVFKIPVDGPSRQAFVSQQTLKAFNLREFCDFTWLTSPDKRPWTIEGDLGVHLSKAGAEVYAQTLLSRVGIRRP